MREFGVNQSNKVKGIAILMLLFHHQFAPERVFTNYIMNSFLSSEFIMKAAVLCRECVWIFVFVSAYGIAKKFEKMEWSSGRVSSVLKKRYFSLMYPYWLVFLTEFLLMSLMKKNPCNIYENNVLYIIIDFFGIADLFNSPTLSGVFWYICLAQLIILFSPLVYKIVKKMQWYSLPILYILLLYMNKGISSQYGGTYTAYLFAVIIGMLCAQNQTLEKLSEKIERKKILSFFLIIFLLIGLFILRYKISVTELEINLSNVVLLISGIIPIFLCLLVILIGGVMGKGLEILGKYSGIMYLTHIYMLGLVGGRIYNIGYVLVCYLIFVIVCFVVAVVFKHFMDLLTKAGGYVVKRCSTEKH